MSLNRKWDCSELSKEAFNASRPFAFQDNPDAVFINTGDVLLGKFLHSKISCSDDLPGQAKKALQKNDILLTEIRPANGRFAYVDFDVKNYVVSTKFMVIESRGRVLPRFLYHVLVNQHSLNEFQRIAESRSGTFPQITFDSIAHFPVPIPPSEDQADIVRFLDAIQLRLDLLRETNATLEAIAQALFKSWFVDFDPVRAKQEGREPEGMDAGTAALFPDSFEESELGLVSKGWVVKSLGQKFVPTKGKNITKLTVFTGEVPVVAGGLTPAYYHNEHNVDGPVTTISASGANAGYVKLYHENIWASDCSYVSKRHTNHVYSMYLFLKSRQAEITHMQQGAAQPHVYPKDLMRLLIVDAPVALWDNFESLVSPFFKQIRVGLAEASCLSNLRDTLLPRLISGQLRLPEAEAIIEEATA